MKDNKFVDIDKNLVAERLKEFARRFDSLAELARLLEMEYPQQLQHYLTGRSLPGFELLVRLRNLGCDPNWLMSGETKSPSASALNEENLKYDDEKMRLEVEEEIDRVSTIIQLWRDVEPISARELRQMLRRWFIRVIRKEREKAGKAKKKKVSTK
ncbi:MAG TPA: hypothetical protein VLX91_10940 [Candidatus Acidoferrales bacterium]|nr:hypothetical protein [Candidatus Acidoferrales bacterium]